MASTTERSPSGRKLLDKAARREKRLQAQAHSQASQKAEPQENGVKVVHEEQILEAIDQLRRRKARPDADRICNYLLRKFSVDARDTIADLHRLIEAEKVIQVDYKGNTSYRNASKWTRLQLYKNRPEGFVKEKINTSMVAGAFGELLVEEPDYLEQGVPAYRLIEQLLDGVSNPTSRRMVEDFLAKEVASGNLTRLTNGNYSMVDSETSSSPQQNGEVVLIPKMKGSNSTLTSTPYKEASPIDLQEFRDSMENDSNSNSIKSRQSSPKNLEPMKKEDCYEIIVGKRQTNGDQTENNKSRELNGKLENGTKKENGIKQNGRPSNSPNPTKEEQQKNAEKSDPPVNQKKSKTERKQRLCVRNDDSTDLVFKFEDFRSTKETTNYKEDQDKDDENDRLSEDGEGDGDNGRGSTNPSPTPSNHNTGSFRSARRKRAKKVFDPSDNMVVKRKRGRYAKTQALNNSQPQDVQETIKSVTLKESPKDPNRQCSLCSKNKQESLVACRDCTVRAHPSCIYTPEEMIIKAHTSWQCERCKNCVVCFETSDAGALVSCFGCDDAYHHSCHTPRIPANKSKWYCSECKEKQYKPPQNLNTNNNVTNNNSMDIDYKPKSNTTTTTITAAAAATTAATTTIITPISRVLVPHVSPNRHATELDKEDMEEAVIDPNIPDASEWSTEQVYQYFYRYFPHEAKIFKTEEIDGSTLMLLKRSDIIGGFGLLMGPALKIWRHVVILQHRRDDTKLYWL